MNEVVGGSAVVIWLAAAYLIWTLVIYFVAVRALRSKGHSQRWALLAFVIGHWLLIGLLFVHDRGHTETHFTSVSQQRSPARAKSTRVIQPDEHGRYHH